MPQEEQQREHPLIQAGISPAGVLTMEEAERAYALLAAIVASSEDAIASKTLDGIVTSCAPQWARYFFTRSTTGVGVP